MVEKSCATTEPLEEGDSLGTDMEWEELDEEGWVRFSRSASS